MGAIWRYPYIARWLHKKTTLDVERYISATKGLGVEALNAKERYSINCLFFRKELWNEIGSKFDDTDDELLLQKY